MFAISTTPATAALLLLLVVTMQLCTNCSHALKVSAHIPELVKLNDAFWLNCSYQSTIATMTTTTTTTTARSGAASNWDDIYAIRWYKDGEEFYKFTPNGQPNVSIYETNGIQLDQAKSHEGNVYINKADVNSEGNYRCEVLSEAPVFETVGKSKHLKVFALPVRGPRIEILDSQGRPKSPRAQEISYAVGDKIELRCNSAPSKPAAKLRWYLNEHEIVIPTASSGNATSAAAIQTGGAGAGKYEVRVTPMEFRQHYKGIYSSHSALSLLLQQDDLINNKISFKCLASMRQEIQPKSKQLIVLMPPLLSSASASASASARIRRGEQTATSDQQHQQQRLRPQNQRHSVTRLHQKLISSSNNNNNNNLMFDDNNERPSQQQQQMLYIYEEANSALGSTIIDTLEKLESYLAASEMNKIGGGNNLAAVTADQRRATTTDNLEYIQLMRERAASGSQATQVSAGRYRGQPAMGGSSSSSSKQKANSLVRSPFYLDENDPLRPIISWPPLESGKLLLNENSNSILAAQQSGSQSPLKLAPPMDDSEQPAMEETSFRRIVLEKLMKNINCTCTDGSIDTRLNWLLNDNQLDTKDTRFYPTRVSPDHRQTILTIGLSGGSSGSAPQMMLDSPPRSPGLGSAGPRALKSLLMGYYHQAGNAAAAATAASRSQPTSETIGQDQIRFACQAVHSMLLHSSSEMITFDFNPPPAQHEANSIVDKFAASSSNVIQAASASQSSSASSLSTSGQTLGSQIIIFLLSSLLVAFYATNRHQSPRFRAQRL